MISTLATAHVSDKYHSGPFAKGQPRVIVVHCTQSPLKRDQAKFRMQILAARDDASAHYLVDPEAVASGVDESNIAWGAGSINKAAIHVEFCGYASYSRSDWTTPDGIAMLRLGGRLIADIAKRHGIPLRLLTDGQLQDAYRGKAPGGITTHMQCTRAIGGTTHGDPGSAFPLDLLLEYATGAGAPEEDEMQLTDTIKVRDPLAQPIDQTYTVAQVNAKLINYLGSLVNKITRLEAKVDALAANK